MPTALAGSHYAKAYGASSVVLVSLFAMAILISSLDASNPLHLHANDSNRTPLISIKLTGVENYRIWASAIKLGLKTKNKMGFITGSVLKSDYVASNLLSEQWDRCNVVVLSWILGSLSQDVYLGHVFSDNAALVWKELQETYDRIDGSIVFTLLQKINSFKQGGLPVSEYYHKLNSLWREFDILTKLPDCVCEARAELIDHGKLMRLMQFLMGLDDVYQPIRSSLLTREILPEVRDAFLIIAREESHRGISSSSVKTEKPQASVGDYNHLLCKNCGLKGHTIERCFEIIGYPPGFKRNPNLKVSNNFNNNKNNNADVKTSFVGNNEIRTSTGTLSFTNEQVQKLMSLLNDKSGSAAHANMAVDVSELNITVGHPNGTLAKITHIGNLRLNNDVVLFDVLVIPEYCVSLLSVHKLIKDSKLSVSFDETKCVIQDLKREKVLGTGSESAGLYVFDANCDKLAVSNQTKTFSSPNDDEEGPSGIDGNVHQPVPDSENQPGHEEVSPDIRRFSRPSKLPAKLNEFVLDGKVKYGLHSIWINAMNEELHALYENNTWELCDLPAGRKPIGSKWVYRIKYMSSGEIERFKARLVAKGFGQKEGIDYEETFSPVVKMGTVRCVLTLAVEMNWKNFQMDVNNAFLYGDLNEEVYMKWNHKLTEALRDAGFVQSKNDHSLFVKNVGSVSLYVLVYVDDLVITGNDKLEIKNFKRKYCLELLHDFGLLGCKPVMTPLPENIVLVHKESENDKFLVNFANYQSQHMHSPLKFILNSYECPVTSKISFWFCVFVEWVFRILDAGRNSLTISFS
ncbi:ribonuclease H-like domain-containing protein [Tanacetum coccineum]|uniref:Ribonuclease H-like domain-containing protein n=1 Tax=Tanacetum coccineum TaxID=301880 RepID=A0ABQ5CUY8_9ASTR